MAIAAFGFRRNLGYFGAHISLLAGAVGLLFLQRYIWLVQLAERGFGPSYTLTSIAWLSGIYIIVDLLILKLGWNGSRTDKVASLAWPAFFFATGAWFVLANNL